MTEVDSLSKNIRDPKRSQCFAKLSDALSTETLIKLEEYYIESIVVTRVEGFVRFGLTDCSILELARNFYLVLTDDFVLARHLQVSGIDVINFNHLRNI